MLRAMKYSGNKVTGGVLQVETDKGLILGERGQSQCGRSQGARENLSSFVSVLTTKSRQNVYEILSFTENTNPSSALSQYPFLKPALPLPVCPVSRA